MAVLEWDKTGERYYQTGINKGVLYPKDGPAVSWNGLTGMDDNSSAESKSFYLDGVKILEHVTPGDFEGKLSAFTYPEEFELILGIVEFVPGLHFYEQPPKSFNLSYQTRINSDLDEDYGYKIHLLYNLKAVADSHKFETRSDDVSAPEFSWSLAGAPTITDIGGVRPAVHIVIDSIDTPSDVLEALEDILYGTPTTDPHFPTIIEIRILFGEIGGLSIIDNGDGTWTAIDPSDDFIGIPPDADSFVIDHSDATYSDPDTYDISDTPYPLP